MKQKFDMHFLGSIIFLIIPLFIFTQINEFGVTDRSVFTISDENFEAIIEIDGQNIGEALEKNNALLVDPNVGVLAIAQYFVISDDQIEVDMIKTVFRLIDLDVYQKTDRVDSTVSIGGNFTFFQTWEFKNYIGLQEIGLISGIYQVRYDLHYTVEGTSKVLKGVPFYVKISGNPVTSVTGLVATAAVAQAGISMLMLGNSMRKSVPLEAEKSIESTKVSPTNKLMSYYQGTSYMKVQNEVSNTAFGYATKLWRGDKCPQCGSEWLEEYLECLNCHISLEGAKELYSKSLVEKSLEASKEIVDSISGLSLSDIAQKLGEGVISTTNIIAVLTFSGLTLAQPRVARSWGVKTRKIFFTGIRTTIFSLFWIQATGIEVISLVMLVIAILSGILIPIIFSKVLGNNIKEKARNFWKKKHTEMETNL